MTLYTLYKKAGEKLANLLYNTKYRMLNKNKTFSIIASNCIGTSIYQSLNLPYNTPTIGLFFYAPCYIKLVYNLEYYLNQTVVFQEQSKYLDGEQAPYPIGRLDDIEIHFMHYHSQKEALDNWIKRCARINFDNLFFIFSDRDGCTYNELKQFDDLEKPRKICFVSKNYPELKSTVWVKEYANQPCIGDLYTNKLYRKYLGIIGWLNN